MRWAAGLTGVRDCYPLRTRRTTIITFYRWISPRPPPSVPTPVRGSIGRRTSKCVMLIGHGGRRGRIRVGVAVRLIQTQAVQARRTPEKTPTPLQLPCLPAVALCPSQGLYRSADIKVCDINRTRWAAGSVTGRGNSPAASKALPGLKKLASEASTSRRV